MLFFRGNLVDLSEKNCKGLPEGDLMGDAYREIEELRSKYFGADKKGVIQLRYPNGRLRKHKASRSNAAVYEPKKIFHLSLKSRDGQWQWSDRMADVNGINSHNYNKLKVSDPWLFYEKDLDLVWFIKSHCPQYKNGSVFFEDAEEVAEKEARETFGDIELKYMLSSRQSPLANDLNLLRDVASAFNIEGAPKMGKWELRNVLFEEVSSGEKRGDKYVNVDKLQVLTDNQAKMKAVSVVRKHMNMDVIKFNHKDNSWYIYSDDEWAVNLLKIRAIDKSNRVHILYDEIINKPQFKGKVFAELGISDFATKAEVKELGRPAVMSMCHQEGIEYEKKDTLDILVEKYCEKMGIKS